MGCPRQIYTIIMYYFIISKSSFIEKIGLPLRRLTTQAVGPRILDKLIFIMLAYGKEKTHLITKERL